MQRRYEYIQTPECLGMGAAMSVLAEGVHERNLKAKADAEAQFELARRDQVKIGARLRKAKERDRNEKTYGKRKKPKQTGTDRTPRTGACRGAGSYAGPQGLKLLWQRWQTRRRRRQQPCLNERM